MNAVPPRTSDGASLSVRLAEEDDLRGVMLRKGPFRCFEKALG